MAKTILLADDSLTIQKVVELTFMDQDYKVIAVGDGLTALSRWVEVQPDLVIADVHMPGSDGYEVCRQVKRSRPDTPVLLLVGTFETFDEGQAHSCGANGYLKKPFDSQELYRLAERLIAESQQRQAAAQPAAPAPAIAPVDPFALPPAAPAAAPVDPFAMAPAFAAPAPAPASAFAPVAPAPAPSFFEAPTPVYPPAAPAFAAPAFEAPAFEAPVFQAPAFEAPAFEAPAPAAPAFEAPAPAVFAAPAPVAPAPAAPAPVAADASAPVAEPAAAASGSFSLSDADVDRIARRVVELIGERAVKEIAWEVVPDLAEVVIKERIRELESQVQ